MLLPFGVLDPQAVERVIPAAAEAGIAVVARGIFAAGLLGDVGPDQVQALRPAQRDLRRVVRELAAAHGMHPLALAAWFARSRPGVKTVLIGMSTVDHLEANVRHLDSAPPSPALRDGLDAALAAHARADAAPTPGGDR